MKGIYKITNEINGKSYIGKSSQISTRFFNHLLHGKYFDNDLHKAIYDYGIENFTFKILEIADDNGYLKHSERYYIEKYDTVNNGYNVTDGEIIPCLYKTPKKPIIITIDEKEHFYESKVETCKETGLSYNKINNWLNGLTKTPENIQIRYANSEDIFKYTTHIIDSDINKKTVEVKSKDGSVQYTYEIDEE